MMSFRERCQWYVYLFLTELIVLCYWLYFRG